MAFDVTVKIGAGDPGALEQAGVAALLQARLADGRGGSRLTRLARAQPWRRRGAPTSLDGPHGPRAPTAGCFEERAFVTAAQPGRTP